MARLAKVVIPGVAHHVTQRDNRRQPTFFQEEDFAAYLTLPAEAAFPERIEQTLRADPTAGPTWPQAQDGRRNKYDVLGKGPITQ